MADNVRDVIRSAQAAELGGDKPRAIELLRLAASLCERAGSFSRALSLLRHALRLEPSRTELLAEVERIESLLAEGEGRETPGSNSLVAAESVLSAALASMGSEEDDEGCTWVIEEEGSSLEEALREAEHAVMPREIPHPSPLPEGEGVFVERGPTRADPSLEAWCSFCCRPRAEVGALVAGPAGAFICSACVSESASLLGGGLSPSPVRRLAPRPPEAFSFLGQAAAQSSLTHALELGVRRLLLIGPEGSGKSTWLRSLEEQGRGVRVSPDALEHAPFEALLLVEDVDRLSPDAQAALATFLARDGQRSVLLSARGSSASPGPVLLSDSGRLPLLTTASLSEAVQGSLSVALLEQVQHLVSLEHPSAELLVEIARRQLSLREQCSLSDEALHALASEAARSPRSGHELRALLARVPPGSWRLEAPSKPARRVRRKGTP